MSKIISVSLASDSLDEFVWDMRTQGMELTAHQLDIGVESCALQAVIANQSRVTRFEVGSRVHHLLGVETGFQTFGLLAHTQAPTRIGRRTFSDDSLLHLDPDHGLEATIEAGFSGYTLAVADDRLAQVAELYGINDRRLLAADPGTTRVIPAQLRNFTRMRMEQAMRLAREAPGDQAVSTFFDEELPSLIVHGWCVNASHRRDGGALSARTRAFRRATEAIRSSNNELRTVEQLCRISASSYSTLERAFREETGLTPKRYLLRSRLSHVRQTLLRAEDQSITEVAHHWGFAHMGKFAADYKRMFGELPSATRRRRETPA